VSGKVITDGLPEHKDGDVMVKAALFTALVIILFSTAGSTNSDHKIAVHVLPFGSRTCGSGLPDMDDCREINHTHAGCEDIHFFPVIFDVWGIAGVQFGFTWPASWGTCAYTPCGSDFTIGQVVKPGDWIACTWRQCQYDNYLVTGFGWLAASSAGRICPVAGTGTDFIGVTGCQGENPQEFEAAALFCAGVCGQSGDDPCGGGVSEEKTWGAIKSMYR
jgi:hypothetical protein